MNSLLFLSVTLFFIILISHAFSYTDNPIIVITQGVIKHENLLPITVFWYYSNFTKGNSLIVHRSDNRSSFTGYYAVESYTGFRKLPPRALIPDGNLDQYCAIIGPKERIYKDVSSCKSKVQWMYDRRHILSSFSLRDLMIPGTHQSAAYVVSDEETLNKLSLSLHEIICQTKSIKTQLMDGIRYLDLRPALRYRNGRKVYLTSYSILNLILIDDVVKQIREFLDVSKDIVIVSFQGNFKGFTSDEDHSIFINYLEFSLANHIHPREFWTHTLSQIWASDKRLILSYHHDMYNSSLYTWPPIVQYWGDVQTINRLHSYLSTVHRDHSKLVRDITPYATMVESTHSAADSAETIGSSSMNLRYRAERLGEHIPRWYIEEWNSTANIVAVDYYQASGIVDVAIQLNEKRADHPPSLPINVATEN